MTPETQFVTWLASRPALAARLGSMLPSEILSEQARRDVIAIRTGTFLQTGNQPVPEEAITFLRTQLLAVLGREAARAQRGLQDCSQVFKMTELLRLLDDMLEDLPLVSFDEMMPEPREFLSTGIKVLDEQISGLAKGELGIVAMPPGRGKTHILLNFTANALYAEHSVHYITVADAGLHELVPRLDSCILGRPAESLEASAESVRSFHEEAKRVVNGHLWLSDFTDRECGLSTLAHVIGECKSDLVIVDHADDIAPPFGDPVVTRHSLRVIYKDLKQLAVKYKVPIWTASQTPEQSWFYESAGISDLAEAKTGKASGAAIVLVFSGGASPTQGLLHCTIAKARRRFSRRTFPLHVDYARGQTW